MFGICPINAGIPQRNVLGPTTFILPSNIVIVTFADNTATLCCNNCSNKASIIGLQNAINQIFVCAKSDVSKSVKINQNTERLKILLQVSVIFDRFNYDNFFFKKMSVLNFKITVGIFQDS